MEWQALTSPIPTSCTSPKAIRSTSLSKPHSREDRTVVTTRDVEELQNDTIRRDTTWLAGGIDKLIYGAFAIEPGVTLTVQPGVTLYLHDHASIEVYGTLRLEGSLEHPVNLLGDRTDKIFDNLYYRDMSAQWGGINIYPSSTGNIFQYAEIRGMTTGIVVRQDSTDTRFLAEAPEGIVVPGDPKRYAYGPDFLGDERQQLIVRNSLIMNSDSSLIAATNSNIQLLGSLFAVRCRNAQLSGTLRLDAALVSALSVQLHELHHLRQFRYGSQHRCQWLHSFCR